MKKIIILLLAISLGFNFYQQRQITQQEEQINSLNEALAKANEKPPLHPIEAETKECMGKTYRTSDISNCILNSKTKWNGEIQKTLSELKKIVQPTTYTLILASQKNWENYEKAQRKVIYNTILNLQGTVYINISHMADAYITENRARELLELLRLLKNE